MTLRSIDFKTNQLQNTEPQDFEELICFAQSFFKLIEFIIRCWTFDVRRSPVSLSIKLAAVQASGAARMKLQFLFRSNWPPAIQGG